MRSATRAVCPLATRSRIWAYVKFSPKVACTTVLSTLRCIVCAVSSFKAGLAAPDKTGVRATVPCIAAVSDNAFAAAMLPAAAAGTEAEVPKRGVKAFWVPREVRAFTPRTMWRGACWAVTGAELSPMMLTLTHNAMIFFILFLFPLAIKKPALF